MWATEVKWGDPPLPPQDARVPGLQSLFVVAVVDDHAAEF